MAVIAEVSSVVVRPYLNDGYDASGNVKVIAGAFPKMNRQVYTSDYETNRPKAVEVADAIGAVTAKSVYVIRETLVSNLIED